MLILLWSIKQDENKPLDRIFRQRIFTLLVEQYTYINDTLKILCFAEFMIFVKYSPIKVLFTNQKKKSHKCKERRAQLRISVWHLLMNVKKNYSLKKLLKWADKKCKNFDINNIVSFLKNQEKHLEISLFYNCVPKRLMIYSGKDSNW